MAMRTSVAASAVMTSTRGQNYGDGNGASRTRSDALATAEAEDSALALETAAANGPVVSVSETRLQRWKRKTFAFFSDPSSSRAALYLSIYMNFLILFSTAAFCVQTVNSLNDSPEDTRAWWVIEIFVISQFTFEYTIRLVTAPNLRAFVVAPLNIVDLIAIVPFYLELVVIAAFGLSSTAAAIAAIRIIRLVRVFRLFKLGQQSRQVRMVARAFARSRDGIFLLVFLLGMAVTFFSALMYFAETASCTLVNGLWIYNNGTKFAGQATQYQSILSAFWWALVTMTTVGYGDVYPITIAGKIIAAVATVTGLLVIAFPITIIGVNLNDIYDEYREQQAKKERAMARARIKELARARDEDDDDNLAPSDIKGAINEIESVQQQLHEQLDWLRTQLTRLQEVEAHADAVLDNIKSIYAANEALALQARLKAAANASLGGADEEHVPMMPSNRSGFDDDDDDDDAGVESFTSADVLYQGSGDNNRTRRRGGL